MKVLLFVNGDRPSTEMLRVLRRLVALSSWSEVLVLHVVPSHPPFVGTGGLAGDPSDKELLDEMGERLARLSGSVSRVLSTGDPSQEVLRLADRFQADLVVLGARARKDFRMGSVCRRVVSMAPADVLVVRERNEAIAPEPREAPERPEGDGHRFRALIAVDGSSSSEAGIDAFATKLRATSASIRILHVVESLPPLREVGREPEQLSKAPEIRAAEVLARARHRLESHGLDAEYAFRRGSPASRILEAAREECAEVIVVGSRGRSAFREVVLGSVTYRVLRHAPANVLCTRGLACDGSALPRWASEAWEPELGTA